MMLILIVESGKSTYLNQILKKLNFLEMRLLKLCLRRLKIFIFKIWKLIQNLCVWRIQVVY